MTSAPPYSNKKITKPFASKRLMLLKHVSNTESAITTEPLDSRSVERVVLSEQEVESYFVTRPKIKYTQDDQVFWLPILFESDGSPWHLANLFLLDLATNNDKGMAYKDTRAIRRKALLLLEYKIFCEEFTDDEGQAAPIDLFNFRQIWKSHRPTWRYFAHLIYEKNLSNASINKKTEVVYSFYKFAAEQPDVDLDISRVDTLTKFSYYITSESGTIVKEVERRSQTLPTPLNASLVDINFVRDEGEDLRPLQKSELDTLYKVLEDGTFNVDEKLIHYFALFTGERKQSILTLRMKHLHFFSSKYLEASGCYRMFIGPKNGCDTKYAKSHKLLVPKRLAKAILTWATSKKAKARRNKFRKKYGEILSDDDIYLFLSPEGNCRYMSKTDPRYRMTKTPPEGQLTRNMKTKLLKAAGDQISPDFTFHWLRATFALRLYQKCMDLVAQGKMVPGEELGYVRRRMHHADQKTTENYLKLFSTYNERLRAQELYEDSLFSDLFTEFEVKG